MLTSEESGSVFTVTMSRPTVNAINAAWIDAWAGVTEALERRADITVLRIRSGLKIFCAGFDVAVMREMFASPEGRDRLSAIFRRLQRLYDRIEALPQVVIAEINGAAMGGGFELALACDLRMAAATARVGLPEVQLGLLPGSGGTQRLTRRCGRALAERIILTAETPTGAEAAALGMVHWAVPADELDAFATEVAGRVAKFPQGALAAIKRCIAIAAQPGQGGSLTEMDEVRRLLDAPETQARVNAFFSRK